MNEDIRWKQRFYNYRKALAQLTVFVSHDVLNFMEEQGMIKAFEYTFELAWNVLRDYLTESGNSSLMTGSKDTLRIAFKEGLIHNGEIWLEMVSYRNLTVHTYNVDTANQISGKIRKDFFPLFVNLSEYFETLI